MNPNDPLRRIRQVQEAIARSWQPLHDFWRHQLYYQRLADEARRVVQSPVARVAAQSQEWARRLALPSIEFPYWQRVLEDFDRLQRRFRESLPANWRDLSMTEMSAVAETMGRTGWGLAWVPRADVLRGLIDTTDQADAEAHLLGHQSEVLEDLQECLGEVSDASLIELVDPLEQGIRCYQADCPFPAQTMAATVLTSIIQQHLEEPNLTDIGKKWRAIDPGASALFAFRQNSLLRAVGTALHSFWPDRGDPIPSLFNRHATVHRFDLTQFNHVNALAGLTLATSFLRELQATAEEAVGGC